MYKSKKIELDLYFDEPIVVSNPVRDKLVSTFNKADQFLIHPMTGKSTPNGLKMKR